MSFADPKVKQPTFRRLHVAPSYATAAEGDAEALEVLAVLLGGGDSGILARTLVSKERIAVGVSASYMGMALDDTRFSINAMPSMGVSLERLDQAIEDVVARCAVEPFDPLDIERAKTNLVAQAIYARDDQMSLATWYGGSLATGTTLEDIATWPERIDRVTADDLRRVMSHLDYSRGVIGYLQPG